MSRFASVVALLLFSLSSIAAEPKAVISGKTTVPAGGMIFLDARSSISDKPVKWKLVNRPDEPVITFDKDGKKDSFLIVPSAEPGVYQFTVVAACKSDDPNDLIGNFDVAFLQITVGGTPTPTPGPTPGPSPTPDPGPGPSPTPTPAPTPPGPPPPTPDPQVVPLTGHLWATVLYNPADGGQMIATIPMRTDSTLATTLAANDVYWHCYSVTTDGVGDRYKTIIDRAIANKIEFPILVVQSMSVPDTIVSIETSPKSASGIIDRTATLRKGGK